MSVTRFDRLSLSHSISFSLCALLSTEISNTRHISHPSVDHRAVDPHPSFRLVSSPVVSLLRAYCCVANALCQTETQEDYFFEREKSG